MSLNIASITEGQYTTAIGCFEENIEDSNTTKFVCRIENCLRSYNDKSACIRHVRINHVEIYNTLQQQKRKLIVSQTFDLELRVKVNPRDIIDACIELIVVNALPLKFVEFPAFRKLLEPYLISLKSQGINLIINRRNVKKCIEDKAAKVKKSITLEVQNRLVSVMIDIATRYNRSILGISICYMKEGRIVVRSIGMHPLHFSATAENIVLTIKRNLMEYEIQLDQVASITSDNGRNIIKAVAKLDECYQQQQESDRHDNDEYIDPDIFDDDYYENLLDRVRSSFDEVNYTQMIHGLSCGAHCFHLVVTRAIKKNSIFELLLQKCRRLVKKLRTPTMRALISNAGNNTAIIDIETRWNSIFSMVSKTCVCIII